jgi:hypothetical protein
MGYMRDIVVQYHYQRAGIGIVLVVVKNHLYPIPYQYQMCTGKTAIRAKEIYYQYNTGCPNKNATYIFLYISVCVNATVLCFIWAVI